MGYNGSERDNRPSFIDLFSGCGGLSLGFLNAGYRCLLAVDNDPKAVECYNRNLKGKADMGAITEDLSRFKTHDDIRLFLRSLNIEPGSCDVVTGGPPCQSFSVAGRNKIKNLMESDERLKIYWNKKDQERVSLFESYALFIEVLAPRWFLFENVPTIQCHEMFPKIKERFENLHDSSECPIGYHLKYDNYLASDYGVPQNRRRFILVGQLMTSYEQTWRPPKKKPQINVAEALNDLPNVTHGHHEGKVSYKSRPSSKYQQMMRQGNLSSPDSILTDHICRSHNPDDVALFGKMQAGARFADLDVQRALVEVNPKHKLLKYSTDKYKDKLHKLDPHRPAWTVTAHLQKDCYKFIHYDQPRTITVREAARLQSFPDWFRFDKFPMGTSFRLIGNAVPPLLARAFAKSFLYCSSGISRVNIRTIEKFSKNTVG